MVERPHRHAAGRPAGHAGDEQPARRPGIRARKVGELVVEALETEIDGERGRVLEEEGPGLLGFSVDDR
jgi:hypothetical protein